MKPLKGLDVHPHCLTVAQLKALIADWPEVGRDGEPTEVWITTGVNLSSPCVCVGLLNAGVEEVDGKHVSVTADMLLETALWDE